MLYRWNNHRQRRVATAETPSIRLTGAGRLGFEAMEDRLMLSGDAPDFVSWGAYSPEFRLEFYQLGAANLQSAPDEYVDGGFILPGTGLFGFSADGSSGTTRANVGVVGPAPPTSVSVNVSGSGATGIDFGGVYLDTPEIPVIGFPGVDGDFGGTFVDQPTDAGPQAPETFADEGGAIPINSILAFVGQTDGWNSRERIALKASSKSGEPNWGMPSVVPPTHSADIAGEWARPMMLEMAGGEPVSIRQPAATEQERAHLLEDDAAPHSRRPLSSGAATETPANGSRAARDIDDSRSGADTLPSDAAAVASRRLSSASPQPMTLLTSHGADAHSLNRSLTLATTESSKVENGSAPGASEMNESANAEVFDQLGTSDAVGEEALFNRDAWRDSWKATPLLMILALERIAASNSRRAKRESLSNAGRPQSHAPAAAHLTDPV